MAIILLIFVINYNPLIMSKYFLIYVLILLSPSGFTQTEIYPFSSTLEIYNSFSLTDSNSLYSQYGIHYYLLYTTRETNWPSLTGKYNWYLLDDHTENKVLISRNYITCRKSWRRNSITFPDDNFGYHPLFGKICSKPFPKSTNLFQSNSNMQSSYGIKLGLTSNEKSPSENLLYYEKPVFDISTLHKDEVVEEILKLIRRQDFDFSGVIQDFYRPGTMPGID